MGFVHFLTSLGLMSAYAIFAIAVLLGSLKLIDWLTPKINIEKELIENKNLAIAIPAAAFILGIAAIIIAVIVS